MGDSSVYLRGVAFPKGVPQEIIDKAAEVFPGIFDAGQTVARMKESGSLNITMTREQVINMFQDR